MWNVATPIAKMFRKDMVLAWTSVSIPVVLSLLFIPILYYARRRLVSAYPRPKRNKKAA
jgi:hypothetical protein